MTIPLKIKSLFNNPKTKKVIATVSYDSIVHVTFKDMLFMDEDERIILLEILERSITNRNLTYSIWFNKPVAINMLSEEGISFHVQVLPIRAIISGKEFEAYYKYMQKQLGNFDLSTVWIFEMLEIRETSLRQRIFENADAYPIVNHLDRITNT